MREALEILAPHYMADLLDTIQSRKQTCAGQGIPVSLDIHLSWFYSGALSIFSLSNLDTNEEEGMDVPEIFLTWYYMLVNNLDPSVKEDVERFNKTLLPAILEQIGEEPQ